MTSFPAEFPGVEVTVNDQGRVTIPVQVRRAAGIEAGVPLVAYVEDGRVVIETREQLADRIRRDVAAAWTGEGSVVDELIADRRATEADAVTADTAWASLDIDIPVRIIR